MRLKQITTLAGANGAGKTTTLRAATGSIPTWKGRVMFEGENASTRSDLSKEGLTILLVEQNVHLALAVSHYAYVLAEGRVHSEGPSRELAQSEDIRKAYLGM